MAEGAALLDVAVEVLLLEEELEFELALDEEELEVDEDEERLELLEELLKLVPVLLLELETAAADAAARKWRRVKETVKCMAASRKMVEIILEAIWNINGSSNQRLCLMIMKIPRFWYAEGSSNQSCQGRKRDCCANLNAMLVGIRTRCKLLCAPELVQCRCRCLGPQNRRGCYKCLDARESITLNVVEKCLA